MSEYVRVLASDWNRLRAAYPGLDDARLAEEAVARGRDILAELPEEPNPRAALLQRLEWLRRWFPRRAGSIAVQGLDLVEHLGRHADAEKVEQRTYERALELHKDVVPPLKEKAKVLRAEVRRLEEAARARGIDPDAIEPRIRWPSTLAVDIYERPQYETNESRKQATVEFFKRLGR